MSDLSVSIDDASMKALVDGVFNVIELEASKETNGSFWFQFSAKCHLEKWNLSLQPPDPSDVHFKNGYILLKDAVVAWDELRLVANVDIPQITLGGCLIRVHNVCLIGVPKITIFGHHPDISLHLDIDNILRSRITLGVRPYFTHTPDNRQMLRQWRLHPAVVWSHSELLSPADTVADLIKQMADGLIHKALGFLPKWAIDFLSWLIGDIAEIIRHILSLPDDLVEWFSQLMRFSIDPLDLLISDLINKFGDRITLYKFDDPIQLMSAAYGPPSLPKVTQNISDANFDIQNDQCIIGISL